MCAVDWCVVVACALGGNGVPPVARRAEVSRRHKQAQKEKPRHLAMPGPCEWASLLLRRIIPAPRTRWVRGGAWFVRRAAAAVTATTTAAFTAAAAIWFRHHALPFKPRSPPCNAHECNRADAGHIRALPLLVSARQCPQQPSLSVAQQHTQMVRGRNGLCDDTQRLRGNGGDLLCDRQAVIGDRDGVVRDSEAVTGVSKAVGPDG